MTRPLERAATAIVATLVLTACSAHGSGGPVEPTSTIVRGSTFATMQGFVCPPGANCSAGFYVGSESYSDPGCNTNGTGADLRPGLRLGRVVAYGKRDFRFDVARTIPGLDPAMFLAVHRVGDLCGGGRWALAGRGPDLPQTAAEALSRAQGLCNALILAPGLRCAEGPPGIWSISERQADVGWTYDPGYVDEVNRELAGGTGPRWRLDPVHSATHELVGARRCSPLGEPCRGAVRSSTEPNGDAVVTLVLQDGEKETGKPLQVFTTGQVFVERRLQGGPGWWTVRSHLGGVPAHPNTPEWADGYFATCCDRVLFNQSAG